MMVGNEVTSEPMIEGRRGFQGADTMEKEAQTELKHHRVPATSNGRRWQRRRRREVGIMDQVMQFVEPSRQFVKDSIRLVKRCTKPDRKEFQKIAMATAIGFAIMGFIGFFVKLIHIPINNIIV